MQKHITGIAILAGALMFSTFASSAEAEYIINTNFTSTGSNQYVAGTTDGSTFTANPTMIGLDTNLPGASWLLGAGWHWSAPAILATWYTGPGDIHDAIHFGEEKTVLGLSTASSGTYTKPTQFTYSASIYLGNSDNPTGTSLVGFWSAITGQDNGGSSLTGFTGLMLDGVNGTLRVYADGAVDGDAVDVTALVGAISYESLYTIAYDVDTTDGSIANVTINGNAVSGLSGSGFSDAATAFVGAASGSGSRLILQNLSLSVSEVPEPGSLSLLALGGLLLFRRK